MSRSGDKAAHHFVTIWMYTINNVGWISIREESKPSTVPIALHLLALKATSGHPFHYVARCE